MIAQIIGSCFYPWPIRSDETKSPIQVGKQINKWIPTVGLSLPCWSKWILCILIIAYHYIYIYIYTCIYCIYCVYIYVYIDLYSYIYIYIICIIRVDFQVVCNPNIPHSSVASHSLCFHLDFPHRFANFAALQDALRALGQIADNNPSTISTLLVHLADHSRSSDSKFGQNLMFFFVFCCWVLAFD